MPVRQERIITLTNAAIEYRSVAALASRWLNTPGLEHLTRDELINTINSWAFQINTALLEKAAQFDATITVEYQNSQRNRVRNERMKIKMQIKRQAAGVKPRAQPRILNETPRLVQRDDIISPPADYISKTELTLSEELELEQQIAALNNPTPVEEEPDEFNNPDGTPKPLFENEEGKE